MKSSEIAEHANAEVANWWPMSGGSEGEGDGEGGGGVQFSEGCYGMRADGKVAGPFHEESPDNWADMSRRSENGGDGNDAYHDDGSRRAENQDDPAGQEIVRVMTKEEAEGEGKASAPPPPEKSFEFGKGGVPLGDIKMQTNFTPGCYGKNREGKEVGPFRETGSAGSWRWATDFDGDQQEYRDDGSWSPVAGTIDRRDIMEWYTKG